MAKLIDDTKKNASVGNSLVKNVGNKVKESVKEAKTQKEQKTVQKPSTVQTNTRQESRNDNPVGAQSLVKAQKRYVDVKEDLTQKYRNNEIGINDKNLQSMFRNEATKNWDSKTAKETGRYDEFLKSRVSAEQERFQQENDVARAKDTHKKDIQNFIDKNGEEIDRIFEDERNRYSGGRSIDDDISDIDVQLKAKNEAIKNTRDNGELYQLYNDVLDLSKKKVKLTGDRNILNEYSSLYSIGQGLTEGDKESQKLTADVVNSKDDSFLQRKAKGTEANFIGYLGEALQIIDTVKDITGEIGAGILEEIIIPAVEDGVDNGVYSQETYDELMRMAEKSREFAANDEKNWSTGFYRAVNQLHAEEFYGTNAAENMILQMVDSAEQQAMRTALASMADVPVKAQQDIGLGIMYGQVMSNKYYSLLDKGYSSEQSFMNAVMSGALEILTEKLNIDEKWAMFSGKASQTASAEILTSLAKHNGSALYVYLNNANWEGVEELLSEAFEPVIDAVTLGEKIEYRPGDFFTAYLSAFGSTMIGAGAGELVYASTGTGPFVVQTKAQYNQLKEDMARAERKFIPSEMTQEEIENYYKTRRNAEAALKGFEDLSSVSIGVDTQADLPVVNTDEEVAQNLKDAVTPELLEGNKAYQERQQELEQLEKSMNSISQQFLDSIGVDATVQEFVEADEPTRQAYRDMSEHHLDTHNKDFLDSYVKASDDVKEYFNTMGDAFNKGKIRGAIDSLGEKGKNILGMHAEKGIEFNGKKYDADLIINTDQGSTISLNGLVSATEEELEAYLNGEKGTEEYSSFVKKTSPMGSYFSTAAHEILHWLKSHNPNAYARVKQMMKNNMGEDYQKALDRIERVYKYLDANLPADYDFEEEALAFYMQENVDNAKFIRELANYSDSAVQRLRRTLLGLLPDRYQSKMRNVFLEGIRTANEQGNREGTNPSEEVNNSLGIDGLDDAVKNNEVNQRIMNEYDGEHRINRFAPDVVEEFVSNVEKNGTRFSLSVDADRSLTRPDGSRKDLRAVHNISAAKLENALELGGLVMPSVAVTKDSIDHSGFGDISIVMDSESIDPKKKDNAVYKRDAWTPMFPHVDREATYESLEKVYNSFSNIPYFDEIRKINTDVYRLSSPDNFTEILDRYDGDPVEAFSKNDSMKMLYLLENGDVDSIPSSEQNITNDFSNTDAKAIMDLIGRDRIYELREELNHSPYRLNDETREEIRQTINDYMNQKYGIEELYNERYDRKIDTYISLFTRYMSNPQSFTRVDENAIKDLAKDVDQTDYENWLKEKFKPLEIQSGIRNNRDYYTPSGSRRSFKQTHDPVTAERVLNYMKGQNETGDAGIIKGGFNSVIGAYQGNFSNINDIISSEEILQPTNPGDMMSGEDSLYKELRDEYNELIGQIYSEEMGKRRDTSVDSSVYLDNAIGEAVTDFARSKDHSVANLKKKFASEYIELSDGNAEAMIDILERSKEIPTDYFEAKPRRIVSPSEWKQAYVPNTTDPSLIQRLEDLGVEVIQYDKNIPGDRQAKMNGEKGTQRYQFSLTLDRDYTQAVESGDMETAQRMVDEEAKRNGFTVEGYHGTQSFGFTTPDTELGKHSNAFWVTDSIDQATTYSDDFDRTTNRAMTRDIKDADESKKGNYHLYVNPDGLLEVDAKNNRFHSVPFNMGDYTDRYTGESGKGKFDTDTIVRYAQVKGYKGVWFKNLIDNGGVSKRRYGKPANVYALFDPQTQVKSADPVTYDDDGNVIPLSERFNSRSNDIRYSLTLDDDNYGLHYGSPNLDPNYKSETLWQRSGRGTGAFGTGTYFFGKNGENIRRYSQGRTEHKVDFSDYNLYKPSNSEDAYRLHSLFKELDDNYSYTGAASIQEYKQKVSDIINDLELESKINEDGTYEDVLLSPEEEEDVKNRLMELGDSEEYVDELLDENRDENGRVLADYLGDELRSRYIEENYWSKRPRSLDRAEDYEAMVSHVPELAELLGEDEDYMYDVINEAIRSAENNRHRRDFVKGNYDSVGTRVMKKLGYEGIDVRDLKGLDNSTFGSVIYDLKPSTIRYSLGLDDARKKADDNNLRNDYGIFYANIFGNREAKISDESNAAVYNALNEAYENGTVSEETRRDLRRAILEETKEEIPVDTPYDGEEMRKYLRSHKISINSLMNTALRDDKHSSGGYGDFGQSSDWRDYMRSHAKYYNFRREGGMDVDKVFQEFAELYPSSVDPNLSGAKDQLDAMVEAVENNMPRSETRYATQYGEEQFDEWVDEKINKMIEDVQKTKEFREKMDSGELKVTDEDLDKLVRRNPINARTMKALEENERIFRENAKSWIPDYDIIREKYDVFSEDVLNDAMYETLMYGHAEPETIQAMTKELVDRLDNVDWRIAESLTNDVNEAVEDMLHYFALDFQYKANQKNIDPVVTRVNNVIKAFDEATDIDAEIDMQKEIVDSLKEAEAFKKSQGDTDLAAMLIQRGADQKTYTWRTLEQNLDYVANGDVELRDRLRVDLELPRSVAQLRRNEIRNEAQKVIDKAKDLGITAGSDESKIAQFYKEGHTNERDVIDTSTQEGIDRKRSNPWKEYTKEQFDTDTNYKMKNGKTAKENIKEVVRMIDDSYNSLILALNMSQTEIYGDVIGQNEYETAQLKAKLERQSKTVEILKEEMKKNDSVEKQGAYNKAVKEYNKLINQLNTKLENDASNDSTRRRFTPLRRNYAHHITKSSLVNDIKGIIKGRDAIPTALNGLSENTLPNTAAAGFMWAQEGGDYIPDLIESYANYVDEASKVLAYNDYIVKLRQITKDLRATATGNEMSRFTDYLEQYANDIAGKRRAIDRAVDKAMPSVGQAIRVANRLGKRAALMFNVNSALVQVANIPNGLGILRRQGGKSYGMDVVKGISDMLNSNREDMKSIMEKSAFMNDRYFDFNTYDNSLKAKIGDLADGMMTIGDKFGANVIWWSAYEQALRKGMTPGGSSAIFYADDITRRTTAGRGVGEVPLGLRSNVLNTIAPFQVENNNSWQTFKQNVKGKQLGALVTAGVFSYLLNMLFQFLKRDDVLPEALSPIVDQFTSDATVEEKLTNIVKGELGELLSALPGGSFLTSLSMGKDKADELFGDYNPSRYGITNIGLTGLGNAVYDAGVKNDGLAALTDLFEGYFPGGKQISRTIEGLQSYGVVPQYNDESGRGMLDPNNWSKSAKSYNSKGQIKFENDPDDIWGMIQSALFGKWASKSAQEYVDNGFKAYGNTATNISKLLDEMGQSTYTKMFSGNVTGENSQKFVDKLNEMGIYDEYLDKVNEKYNEYLDTVPEGEKPDTFNKFANSYGLTKAVMDGTYEPKESVQTEAEPQKEESGFDFFSFLRNEKEEISDLYSQKADASAEEKEEIQNEIDKKQKNLQNNVYSNYSSSRKMDEKKTKTFQSAMDLDGLYKDAKGNVSDNNSTGAKKVRNSEAIETRKALEDMGEYESVLDYIAQNGLDYSDFGLTKTVVGWNDSKFDSEYAEMFGGETSSSDKATKTSYRSTGSRRSGSRRSSSTASSDLARHSSAVLSRSKNNRYSSTMSLLTQLQNARRKNSTLKSYKDYMKKRG